MRTLMIVTGLAASLSSPAISADISGSWKRGDGVAQVRISKCGKALCAVNTWINDPSGQEKVGDKLIFRVKKTSTGVLKGRAFDPQRNMDYSLKIRLGENSASMTTEGCLMMGMVCKSMKWSRR